MDIESTSMILKDVAHGATNFMGLGLMKPA